MRTLSQKKGGLTAAFFHVLTFGFCAFLFLISVVGNSQSDEINIVFYNVENLFDTIDNPLTKDEDFTPHGKLAYDSHRYNTKLKHIAAVLDSSFQKGDPDIIGLCEVENEQVLIDLTLQLPKRNWKIVHVDSPDGRGIDNAIIFNANRLVLLHSQTIGVDLGKDERPSRDILQVELQDRKGGGELVLFVNHWPSRYGGAAESNWKRMKASQSLSEAVRKVENATNRNIIIMGDFNDHPDNSSIQSLSNCDTGLCMINLYEQFLGSDNGTHVYKGEWGVLDQILVTKNLLNGTSEYSIVQGSVGPYKSDFMLFTDKKSGKKFPSRTYGGPNYYGGYSDHLPVRLTIRPKS